MLEAAGDLVEAEVLRDAVHAPWAGVRFKRADEESPRIVLVVGVGVVVAHHGKVRIEPLDRLEQGVVVLAGM